MLLGKVLRQGPTSPLHRACFIEGTLRPATSRYVRKVGRPCYEWVSAVLPEALRIAGGTDRLLAAAHDEFHWKQMVKSSV